MFKVYSTSWCSYCNKAKGLLQTLKKPFKEFDIDTAENFDLLVEELGYTPRTIPQVFYNDTHLGGYEELKKYLEDK